MSLRQPFGRDAQRQREVAERILNARGVLRPEPEQLLLRGTETLEAPVRERVAGTLGARRAQDRSRRAC